MRRMKSERSRQGPGTQKIISRFTGSLYQRNCRFGGRNFRLERPRCSIGILPLRRAAWHRGDRLEAYATLGNTRSGRQQSSIGILPVRGRVTATRIQNRGPGYQRQAGSLCRNTSRSRRSLSGVHNPVKFHRDISSIFHHIVLERSLAFHSGLFHHSPGRKIVRKVSR